MNARKFLLITTIASFIGILFSLVGLFQSSSFSEVPGIIAKGEKNFWIWITVSNTCFIIFVVCLYFFGLKNEVEPKNKK